MRHLLFSFLCFFVLSGTSAFAITDEDSTGPGQGEPDGLDDLWQAIYGGWGLSANGDEDFDGCSNLVECVAGSNPRNPGDCFKVGNMVIGGANIIMNFDAKKGKEYQVWESNTPGGPAPSEPGSAWQLKSGANKLATSDGMDSIVFPKPSGTSKFYRLESKDHDTDNDGVSDWAEAKLGSNATLATSPTNASGGAASDLETLKSLLTLRATPGVADAFEKEGTQATIQLQRSYGTMPLTVNLAGLPGATDPTKSSASAGDFIFKNLAGTTTNTVTLPENEGTTAPYTIARVSAVSDNSPEVPEALKVTVAVPGAPAGLVGPEAVVSLKDADPSNTANRTLYIAYLGREDGALTTASGYATALVNGDNTSAAISVVFNNLSSEQNTAYIRYGPNNDLAPALPNGQVSGFNYNVAYKPGFLATDQEFLSTLAAGGISCAISSANYSDKEIFGFFNKASGSTTFDPNNTDLEAPVLGSAQWSVPTGDALEREIWRFMSQATFGGTTAMYTEIRAKVDAAISGGGTYIDGLRNWLDDQMDLSKTPQISLRQLMMAADMEEYALRGNKPITYNSDPQLNGGSLSVTFVNGMPMANAGSPNTNDPGQNYPVDSPNRRREWWTMILQSKDHVRQRMAQALHEITVISERDANVLTRGYGAANYWDMLAAGAFGQYRTLLEQVSLNPMMGFYLTSISNRATYESSPGSGLFISPDENYAREIMQLFSIGLVLRHPDGSLKLSSEGLPIATYDNNDITELARVFTGFSFGARHGNATTQVQQQYGGIATSTQRISPTIYFNGTTNNIWFGTNNDLGHLLWQGSWIYPMKVMGRIGTTVYHDFNGKTLLSGKHAQYIIPSQNVNNAAPFVPATDAATHDMAYAEVKAAHDVLAGIATRSTYSDSWNSPATGHLNTPVNISRWLIQRLVTSNPSAGYIYRVAETYRQSNGRLGDVVKAILLDWEARSLQLADTSISFGRVKEPLVHFAAVLRQFRAYSGAPVKLLRDMNTGFSDLDAPMSGGYPSTEYDKFSLDNANPPSKPVGWGDGPFRIRINSLRTPLGQSPQDAPSVFNWFLPDYVVPGSMAQAGLFAPELQIANEANEVAKINHFYSYTWMSLAGMTAQPGVSGENFVFRNGWATPAVRFSTNGGASFLGWPATIVLDATNWNTGVTLTMVGVNDQRVGQMASSAVRYALSGTATGYSGIVTPTTPVSFVDNEAKNESLVITQTGGNTWVQEGTPGLTDTFSVMLSCPPAAGTSVNVALASQNGEVSASALAAFTNSNWNTPQIVTVSSVEDSEVEDTGAGNDSITFTTTSDAANYNGIITPALPVTVVDNDNAFGVLITQSGGTSDVNETGNTFTQSGGVITLASGTDSYTIVLTKVPTGNVVVNCSSNGQLGINGAPSGTNNTTHSTTFTTGTTTRTFTTSNWNVPQTVVVRGNDDTTSEGPHTGTITHSISTTTAGGYPTTLPIQQVVANITDNDNAIMLAHSGTETRVMEGEITDTITVRLRTAPNAQVSLALGGLGLKFNPAFLTFEPTGTTNLWSAEQTVTVSALDDYQNEGLFNSNITAYTQSSGTNYNGTSAPLLPVTIIDNDDSRLVINESGGGTLVNEDGTNDTYTLSLGRRPKAGSTTTVTLTPGSGVLVSPPGPIVFTDSNWNNAVTITVSAANDATYELRSTVNIIHNITSTDPTYNLSSTPYLVVTIDDNDPPFTITQTNVFTQVREGGTAGTGGTPNAQDTFTIAPARTPVGTLTVTLVPNSQVVVSPSVLTFTSTTAQTVTVTAVDDATAEATVHQGIIGFNLTSSDPFFNGAAVPNVLVQVTDNDSPGLSIVESSNTTSLTEGGTDTYTIVPTQAPAAGQAVVVDLTAAPAGELLLSAVGTLSNCATVNGSKNVTTTSTAGLTIGTAISGTGIAASSTVASIVDGTTFTLNNNATATNSGSTLTNGATTAGSTTVTVASTTGVVAGMAIRGTGIPAGTTITTVTAPSTLILNTAAIADGTGLTFTTGLILTTTRAAATTNQVVFNETNWITPQTITITGVNDNNPEGRGIATVTHTVRNISDPAYAALSPVDLKVFTADSSTRNNEGLTVAQTGGSTYVAEGGVTDSFLVVLNAPPVTDIPVVMSANTQVACTPSSLTFTPTNWFLPQVVTLAAIDDTTVEGNHSTTVNATVVTTTAPLWNGLAATSSTINIVDNDRAGVIIDHTGGSTDTIEGGVTDTYTVQLSRAPNGNVVISATSASTTAGQTVSPTSLTFNASNWNVPQSVTVTAFNDTTLENNHTSTISHAIVPGTTTDTSGFVIALAACGITNGSPAVACANTTGLYTGMVVTVNGAGSGIPANATVASITSTGFTLSANATATNASINLKATLTGLHTITNNITDNDNRIILTQTATGAGAPSTMVNENGTLSDSYDVVLRSPPTADVIVNLTAPSGQGFAASTASLVFTTANWSTPQTVNLTGMDNGIRDRRRTANITHASVSTDTNFNALTIPAVAVTVNTIDTAQIVIVESGGSTAATEASATDSYTIVLSQAPTSNVVIAINTDSQVVSTPASVTFTPANWNTVQTVSLRAVDDRLVEPILHYSNITHSVTTDDTTYQGLTVAQVVVSITDNDSPRMILSQTGGNTIVTESASASGNIDSYSLVLDNAPTADVVVTITPDAQVSVNGSITPITATFTSANWNVPQTITVTSVDDALVETTTHIGGIAHSIASADPFYQNLSAPVLNVTVWDNDSPGLDISPVGGTDTIVTEGGTGDSILIKLNTAPSAPVTITLYPPAFYVPPPQIGKTNGYFTNDQGSSNERDNIVIDYTESIQLYRNTFYTRLRSEYGGTIPTPFPTVPTAEDNTKLRNAHWAATKAMIDKMDLWFSGGSLKARHPVLENPGDTPLPVVNPRQTIMEAIYALSGGAGLPSTTRYAPEVTFDPKAPPTDTFANEVRDRCRWAGYLMTVGSPGLVAH